MPFKWSAVRVSEAMDEVERQINLAEAFLVEAKVKVTEARKIANLPQYLDDRLIRLIIQIERIDYVKDAVMGIRKAIPDGALETERDRIKYGSQQTLIG